MDNTEINVEEIMQTVAKGRPFLLLNLVPGKTFEPVDEAMANDYQMRHLTYLFSLHAKGEVSVFGPVMNDPNLNGIMIFNTTDKDKVKELMKDDPYISEGYLTYSLHEFFTIPGQAIAG